MSRAFEHLVDAAAAVIILFIFPLIYFGQKQDALIQTMVSEETKVFVNDVRGKGYLTKEAYELYIEKLSKTGLLYEVVLEHKQDIQEPEYRIRSEQEVIDGQNAAYTGSNILVQLPITTDIPVVSDPVNSGEVNTETNESVLSAAVDTPASPGHAHTDACYNGIKHIHTGSPSSGGGCYTAAHVHTAGCYTATYCSGTWSGDWLTEYRADLICSFCGIDSGGSATITTSNGYPSPWEWTCLICRRMNNTSFIKSNIIGDWIGHCTGCSYSITSNNNMQGFVHGNISILTCGLSGSYTLNCNKAEGHYYIGDTEVFPVCSQIVASITPTHPVQTAVVGDSLITTVTAIFQDGSTKVVLGNSSFSTANPVQDQTATITYSYSLNGTTYIKTCSITVTIIPRNKTCTNGHIYNLNLDGSDPGCPYCRSWLKTLQITYPANGSLTIYKGTSLQDNGVTLKATYLDGHTQVLFGEYIDNLDENYVGTQNVTISYKGLYETLTVITKRMLKLCPICNRYYELYPDLSDPGCPYCQAKTPVFTGNVMNYYAKYYSDEILKELYEASGTYYFSNRDYFTVIVKNARKSRGRRLLEFFLRGFGDNGIQIENSGYIRQDGKK